MNVRDLFSDRKPKVCGNEVYTAITNSGWLETLCFMMRSQVQTQNQPPDIYAYNTLAVTMGMEQRPEKLWPC